MINEYTTIRIWTKTLKKLRFLHALTGDSMVAILDEMISKELKGLPMDISILEKSDDSEHI